MIRWLFCESEHLRTGPAGRDHREHFVEHIHGSMNEMRARRAQRVSQRVGGVFRLGHPSGGDAEAAGDAREVRRLRVIHGDEPAAVKEVLLLMHEAERTVDQHAKGQSPPSE